MTNPIPPNEMKVHKDGQIVKQDGIALPVDPMVSMIERVAMDPNADLAKLERMLELKEKHDTNQAKAAFAAAFANAAVDFPMIPLNGTGHNDKKYATLADITKMTRPILSAHGLALSFSIDVGETVKITAELMHKGGYSKTTSIDLPRENSGSKNAVQAVGSSQTYGQRYTAQAILGLSLGDDTEDDGRGSGAPVKELPKKQYSWEDTITEDLPDDATQIDKAKAIASALCAQFHRMKGERQIDNEWDRRAGLISKLEKQHADLWGNVIQAYEERRAEIVDAANDKENG